MRLFTRQRRNQRGRGRRIAISEAEISADLHYPATPRRSDPTLARGFRSR